MNEIKIFENEEFGRIRSVVIDGKIYFVASDIARALGYEKPNNAVSMHCRYTLKQGIPHPQNPCKQIEVNVIPEGDMYRLIVHSKLKSAERFERWVFDEVLPTIRMTGTYTMPGLQDSQEKTVLDKLLDKNPEELRMIESILYAPAINQFSGTYRERRLSCSAAATAFKVRAIGKSQELASIRRHRDPKLARKEIFREMTARGVCWGSIKAAARSVEPMILDTNLDHLSVLPQFQEVFFRAADDLIREGDAGR